MAMTEWQDVGMSGAEKEQLQAIYDKIISYNGYSVLNKDIVQGVASAGTTIDNLEIGKTYLFVVSVPMTTGTNNYILNDKLAGATIIKNSDETIGGSNPYTHLKSFLIRATETTITYPSNYAGAYMIIEVP